jgi:serine/threonine protein kinase
MAIDTDFKTIDQFKNRYRYTTDDKIAKGGFATVFKAYDTARTRTVAIKRAELDAGAEFTLAKEFKICNELVHPNIMHYEHHYSFPQTDGGHEYLVMEFYEAGNLEDFLTKRKNKLNPAQQKAIISDILQGLAYLHNAGFIHRDLKAENILIKDRGNGLFQAVIADFGVSKLVAEDKHTQIILTGANPLSLAYATPEQLNNAKTVRKNIDLWQVGVILYRIVAGELPFTVSSLDNRTAFIQISDKVLNGKLPAKVNELPQPYQAMILTCLKVNPQERVQSAEKLLDLLNGRKPPPPPPPKLNLNFYLAFSIGVKYALLLSIIFAGIQTLALQSFNPSLQDSWEIKLIPGLLAQAMRWSIPIFLGIAIWEFHSRNQRRIIFLEGFLMGLMTLCLFGLGSYISSCVNFDLFAGQWQALDKQIPMSNNANTFGASKIKQIMSNLSLELKMFPKWIGSYWKWGGVWLIGFATLIGFRNWVSPAE